MSHKTVSRPTEDMATPAIDKWASKKAPSQINISRKELQWIVARLTSTTTPIEAAKLVNEAKRQFKYEY